MSYRQRETMNTIIKKGGPKPTQLHKRRQTQMSNQKQHSIPTLSPQALEVLHSQYSRKDGHQSLIKLSQGETDVLHLAREALGWPTITSLAHKYYPLYPNRQWWKRSLERCGHQKVRTVTLNIKYLLLALATVKAMALKAAFSGKEALNRLVHSTNNSVLKGSNRLVPQGGIVNIRRQDQGINPFLQKIGSLEVPA